MTDLVTDAPVLAVTDLTVDFATDEGTVRAVDGVSLTLARGKTLGVVGESGCGKSVTALSILRLVPVPPGRFVAGTIALHGRDLLQLPEAELRKLRGDRVSMIFQEPMTSLNPVFTVGEQIAEAVRLHQRLARGPAMARAVELLRLVGIAAPEERVAAYPHHLSGGMRQRVMIAMALACTPDVLIADEPTTALDVTIQAQIMDLLARLQRELGMSILLITHDLGVVAESCDDVVVMYAGRVVEQGSVADVFRAPRHPYTLGLLRSVPSWARAHGGPARRLAAIPGMVPDLRALPRGCRFQDRCDRVVDACRGDEPALVQLGAGHAARCVNPVPTDALAVAS